MEKKWRILLVEKYDDAVVARLCEVGEVVEMTSSDEAGLINAISDFDALLVRTYTQVSRKVIEAGKRLKVIGRGGVGLENIDVEAAQERNIQVVYTPAASTEAVADLAIGMIIDIVRGITRGDSLVRTGRFGEGRAGKPACELSELTLGIVGLGRIGRAIARRARHGFGMTIIFHDIVMPGWLDFSAQAVSADELYSRSDVVSLNVPLTPLTRGMINAKTLGMFKPSAYLVNTSRGGVVDPEALAKSLHSGQIAGVALDVFDPEPLPAGHPLLTAPNTIFTPHIGSRTRRSQSAMNDVVGDVIRVLQGKPPHFPAWEELPTSDSQ
ncbi:MAG: hydroxyacid dehydrogenase [Planctomycetes bacterium]|nr:hydroxyacid dehydrogenase [Planctomycetota bacterium]MBI3832960.1 hydroxyacid dehydrogenase [Planctomycetota bacterium]